jgi:hypothetical protein
MIRHYQGLAIDCDSDDCLNNFTDSCTISLDWLTKAARAAGWHIATGEGERDLCSGCVTRTIAAAIRNSLNNPLLDGADYPTPLARLLCQSIILKQQENARD